MGEVEPDRREGDIAIFQSLDIGSFAIAKLLHLTIHPIVDIVARVGSTMEDFDKAGAPHARDTIAFYLVKREIGDVDIEECVGRQSVLRELGHEVARDSGGGIPDGVCEGGERNCHAGNPENHSLCRCGDSPRVDHADARVGPEVDAADHEVGPFRQKGLHGQFYTVGGSAADGMTEKGSIHFHGPALDRIRKGNGVADSALLHVGRDDVGFAQVLNCCVKSPDAGRVDAVVIANQNSHGWNLS